MMKVLFWSSRLETLPSCPTILSQWAARRPKLAVPCIKTSTFRGYSTQSKQQSLEYPSSSTSNHNDLASFLEYTKRTNLDRESTIYQGTHYEYTVSNAFTALGMALQRIGGVSDNGIDLLGTWNLPSSRTPIKVLIQCKALALSPIRPATVRELEGAFVGAPKGWRDGNVLGLLVSQKSATKGVREALGRSRWPMGYVLCEKDGKVRQMLWNRKAEDVGMAGMGVGTKYVGGAQGSKEVVLTWKDEAVDFGS